jgi:hypothetical protein
METLISTSFFDLMTNRNGVHSASEVELFTSYKAFISVMKKTCDDTDKLSAFFMLNYRKAERCF